MACLLPQVILRMWNVEYEIEEIECGKMPLLDATGSSEFRAVSSILFFKSSGQNAFCIFHATH